MYFLGSCKQKHNAVKIQKKILSLEAGASENNKKKEPQSQAQS